MLQALTQLPADPILGLSAACRADPNPRKVDLTVGVYKDEKGECPVFEAVRLAQAALVEEEGTKAYLPAAGDEDFNRGIQRLTLGEHSSALAAGRVSSIQTPGGCGALRIGAEIIHAAAPDARVWVPDPTWPVHIPLLGSVGLQFHNYRYYDPATHGVNFDGMLADLKGARAGDVVLLHGCCHNPCGADLVAAQWGAVADLAERQGFTPFVDFAYQGMADGLEEDAAGLRLLVSRLPEVYLSAATGTTPARFSVRPRRRRAASTPCHPPTARCWPAACSPTSASAGCGAPNWPLCASESTGCAAVCARRWRRVASGTSPSSNGKRACFPSSA